MGFLEFPAAGAPPAPIEVFPEGSLLWSDAAAWDGNPPAEGDAVRIEAGRIVVLDQDIDVASLEIEGTLLVAARDTRVRAGWILVRGAGRL
ncbi:MAG TPA: G8 domain-containing protein, partial [Burkholderiaceae bacterium]|nr:G8 domain-containing protein [Burkholderiaceae bacterium]